MFCMVNPLYEQHCAFTGRLQKYTRKEAMQILADLGGLSERGVTKKTRFLILGTQVKDGKSRKQLKAEKNLEKGAAGHSEKLPVQGLMSDSVS